MNNTIEQRILNIIAKSTQMSPDAIKLDHTIEELFQDSLDLVSLLFELEDEFDISIPDDVKTSKTVKDIVLEIKQYLNQETVA